MVKSSKSTKSESVFTGTEVGALVEDFSSNLKVVSEGVLTLNNKFDRLDKKIDVVDARLERVEVDVTVIKMDIEQIKHNLKSKISRDEFAILERRVAMLESRR